MSYVCEVPISSTLTQDNPGFGNRLVEGKKKWPEKVNMFEDKIMF